MKTFNKFLHEKDPELYQYLISVNLRREVTNIAEQYATERAMDELQKVTNKETKKLSNESEDNKS